MKLSALILGSMFAIGTLADAQNNPKPVPDKPGTSGKQTKPLKSKKDTTATKEPLKPKKHEGHYCPACGMG